jgi:hypothetical protein
LSCINFRRNSKDWPILTAAVGEEEEEEERERERGKFLFN